MAKLFATEDIGGGSDVTELEATPEVGEAADAQVEVTADVAEIETDATNIEEGMNAADQLEDIKEVVETAADGEGLDPIAAEAIRIAVEAIASNVGANPKSVYSLYATENFQSASSRRANTRIAAEGVGEFLKTLWEKIKAVLTNLWAKVKEFWNKNFSTLNRSLNALESMKERVSQIKGSSGYDNIDVPANLKAIFPTKADLGLDEVIAYTKANGAAWDDVGQFKLFENTVSITKLEDVTSVLKAALSTGVVVSFGDEKQPLAGGQYFKWTFKVKEDTDDGVVTFTLDEVTDHGKYTDASKNAKMDIASKEKLKELITQTIADVKALIKYRDKVEQRNKAVANTFKAIDKEIDAIRNKKKLKSHSDSMRAFNLVMSKGPMIETKLLGITMTHVRGVLLYTATCAKQYK